MLEVVNANNLEILADELAARLRDSGGNLFSRPRVAIASPEMERWVSLAIAKRLGITSQIDFVLPARLIWDLLKQAWPDAPTQSPFERGRLAMRFLEPFVTAPHLLPEALRAYLHNKNPLAQLAFARRLAEQFDRYIVYRPDWITAWEAGEQSHWQAELWRRVAPPGEQAHWAAAATSAEVAAKLATGMDNRSPIYFFAPAPLSRGYLNLMRAVSHTTEVVVFLHNPCRAFWSDIADRKTITRVGISQPDALPYFEEGNRLLASLGGQLRGFVSMLQDICDADEASYQKHRAGNLLHHVQNNLLDLEDQPWESVDGDASLEIHVCHSRLREVEVLQDQLLNLLESDSQLHEHEIGVYVTDLGAYAPLINAVFGNAPPERRLHIGTSRKTAEQGTLTSKVMRMFDVAQGRFGAEAVSSLLDMPSLQRRFAIDPSELDSVRRWIIVSGARWGLDADHIRSLDATAHHNSWAWARRRLLAAYSLASSPTELFAGVHVSQELEGTEAEAVGGLLALLQVLADMHTQMNTSRPVGPWAGWFRRRINQLLEPDETEQWELQVLMDAAARVQEDADVSGLRGAIGWEIFVSFLDERLAIPSPSSFLASGISLLPLRPGAVLPFKVVYLLGLNDGAFPRLEEQWDIDLTRQQKRLGDRSAREESGLIFLEALTRASEAVRLSYIGRDQQTDEQCPPAPCVAELTDYLVRDLGVPEAAFRREHPLQPFSNRYDGLRLLTYEQYSPAPTQQLPSFVPDRLDIEQDSAVELADLLDFYRHPARHLLRRHLGIALEDVHSDLDDLEPLTLEALDRWALRQQLLTLSQMDLPDGKLRDLLQSNPKLPTGPVGEGVGEDLLEESKMLAQQAARWVTGGDDVIPVALDLSTPLRGSLFGFGIRGRIELRPGALRMRHLLPKWIEHLAFNLAGPEDYEKTTAWMTINDHAPGWVWHAVEPAAELLNDLVAIYQEFQGRPLPFAPETSYVLEHNAKDPLYAARKRWEGKASEPWHEGGDPYNRLLFGADPLSDPATAGAFKELAQRIYRPMIDHNQGSAS